MAKAELSAAAGFDARHPARQTIKIIEFALILAAFFVAVIWFGGAYTNQDPLWFYPVFEAQPTAVRIYYYGATRELRPGEAGYEQLVSVINTEIVRHAGYVESLYPHGDSLEHYQTKGYAIELEYAAPVRLHTHYFFPAARRLMIAIDGSFNYTDFIILFRGSTKNYLPGGIALKNIDGLRAAVEAVMARP